MPDPSSSLSLVHRVRPPVHDSAGRAPLLLLLHGFGSNENDLMGLAPYLDPRLFIVSARGPITLAPDAYAWFPLIFTAQGPIGNPRDAEQSRQALARFIPEVVSAYSLDSRRVYLMGFSQGAMMALSLTLTQPEMVAGAVIMSGRLPPGTPHPHEEKAGLRDLPIFVAHGIADTVLPIDHGREIRAFLESLPVQITYREYPFAHEVNAQSLSDIAAWFHTRLDTTLP